MDAPSAPIAEPNLPSHTRDHQSTKELQATHTCRTSTELMDTRRPWRPGAKRGAMKRRDVKVTDPGTTVAVIPPTCKVGMGSVCVVVCAPICAQEDWMCTASL